MIKRRNIFDLLALKESMKTNEYSQKIKNLLNETSKISKIITQLNKLCEEQIAPNFKSAGELKAASNIQTKVYEQLALANAKLFSLNNDIKNLEKNLSIHELRRKKSSEKSSKIKRTKLQQIETKIESELPIIKKTIFS